jgi:hypothetical protein
MANKKRRRRPRSGPGGATRPQRATGAAGRRDGGGRGGRAADAEEAGAGADGAGRSGGGRPHQQQRPRADRQARKQQAREAREAAMRARRRRDAVRRLVISGVVAAAAVGLFLFLTRVGGPNDFPPEAQEAAAAASCSDVTQPSANPVGGHLAPDEAFAPTEEPATSGRHDATPLPGSQHVYTEMPSEAQLVHNLEHAFVNIYYRADGETALPQDVVDTLTSVAEADTRDHVILSPHTSLPEGTDLAFTAWNQLLTCPSTVTADQARTIAQGFMTAFECTSNAPEPTASSGC